MTYDLEVLLTVGIYSVHVLTRGRWVGCWKCMRINDIVICKIYVIDGCSHAWILINCLRKWRHTQIRDYWYVINIFNETKDVKIYSI